MSSAAPLWQPAASSDLREGLGDLQGCLLTTFEPPDADFLVEDVLPAWLGMSRTNSEDAGERTVFLVDLQSRLRDLRGRLSVFSSARPTIGGGHWLWSDFHLHTVGAKERATQHAKVWLLHRAPATPKAAETLEVVVSSANLTRPAFVSQVQAGWRLVVTLERASTQKNLKSWGPLPAFLRQLANHSGSHAAQDLAHWLDAVLPRAACPADVTFVASVPGRHQASTLRRKESAWGTAGTRFIHGSGLKGLDIVVPTLGTFERDKLRDWAKRFGVRADRIWLAWAEHGRADVDCRWQMPKKTAEALSRARVEVRRFPDPSEKRSNIKRFHPEWSAAERWMHGKLYWLHGRTSTRLLITSANLSEAAWGAAVPGGGLRIRNFEFGVAFDCDWTPVKRLPKLEDPLYTQAPVEPSFEPELAWAEAAWDGKHVTVQVRLARSGRRPSEEVLLKCDGTDEQLRVRWVATSRGCFDGRAFWSVRKADPRILGINVVGTAGEPVQVPIADVRPVTSREGVTVSGVSQKELAALEMRLLEERYGGRAVGTTGPSKRNKDGETAERGNGATADYGVGAIVHAREKFEIVSRWGERLDAAAEYDRPRVLRDGERLAELWRLSDGLPIRVALDELLARLEVLR